MATLNKVEPYDWAGFLRARLDGIHTDVQGGIRRGGYRLVYGEEPTSLVRMQEARTKATGLTYSIGASFDPAGKITAVLWDSPVFKAGLPTNVTVLAVNGKAFDPDRLKAAVKATKTGEPLEFLYRQGDSYLTARIDYKGGLRYPNLERVEGTPDLLGDILSPRTN